MKARGILFSAAVLLASALCAAPAWALTGEDVVTWMSKDERGGYLSGTVEMAAFLSALQGNRERADCIMDWYYEKEEGPGQIVAGLKQFKDRQALPVIHYFIAKACGE